MTHGFIGKLILFQCAVALFDNKVVLGKSPKIPVLQAGCLSMMIRMRFPHLVQSDLGANATIACGDLLDCRELDSEFEAATMAAAIVGLQRCGS